MLSLKLKAGKKGKCKDLQDFDKGRFVLVRQLGQSNSKTAALVECGWSVVVRTYPRWSKEGQPSKQRQGPGQGSLMLKIEWWNFIWSTQQHKKSHHLLPILINDRDGGSYPFGSYLI